MSATGWLEHVGIGARRDKYEETIAFYEKVFGWHRIKEQPGDLAFIGDGKGGRLEILARDEPPLTMPRTIWPRLIVLDAFEASAPHKVLAALRQRAQPRSVKRI